MIERTHLIQALRYAAPDGAYVRINRQTRDELLVCLTEERIKPTERYHNDWRCTCGRELRWQFDNYCSKCGRQINWSKNDDTAN